MIGQAIGSYQIVAKLGEGGMGAVYLGEHQHIARKAAIKVLLPEFSLNQQIVARFFNEAKATSLIRHPGIVDIIDCSVLPNGNAYIVMEHLVGESLGSHLRGGRRLPVSRAAFLTRHIADALAAAHGQRIIHRDLKPDNVFLLTASEAAPVKILDFGIAKLMHTGTGEGSYKTRTGSIMGTPVYMSPEQCRGVGDIDHRTDIYSLGCILFEMIAGRPPFTHEGFGELINAHLSIAPPRLRSLDAAVPAGVDALVARLLAKSPGERPQTMRELISELDAAIAAGPTPEAPERAVRPVAAMPIARPASAAVDRPKVQTTFGSAASEKRDVVTDNGAALMTPTRSRRPLFVTLGAIAAAAAVVAIWAVNRPAPAEPPGIVEAVAPPAPQPAAVVTPSPAPQPAAVVTPPPAPAPAPPPPLPAPTPPVAPAVRAAPARHAPAPAPVSRKIKVVITSEPAGADVCLKNDRILLGKTKFEWSADKSTRTAKLLVRKRGYRGQELAVTADRDSKKQITLVKLGPDDLDDTDNCERR